MAIRAPDGANNHFHPDPVPVGKGIPFLEVFSISHNSIKDNSYLVILQASGSQGPMDYVLPIFRGALP